MPIDSLAAADYYDGEMDTRIVQVNPEKLDFDKIKQITDILTTGGIVIYPTDTFYGLGANCFSLSAVRRAYRLKKRPLSKPLSVVISDMTMLDEIAVDIPSSFRPLEAEFWPGPLTFVLRASPDIPEILRGPQSTIGVRLPDHSWLRRLVRAVGSPITATSANLSGLQEIFDPAEVIRVFRGKVDCIVDGGLTRGGLSSTVLDLTAEKPAILREGAVSSSRLKKFIT